MDTSENHRNENHDSRNLELKVHRKLAQCNSPFRLPLYRAISFYHTTGHIIIHSTFHHHYLCVPLRPTSLCWVQRWLISGCLPGKGFIRCHVLAWLWPHHHDLHSPGLLGDYGGRPQHGGPPSSDGTCGCLTVSRWKVCAKFKLKYALGKRHRHKLCIAIGHEHLVTRMWKLKLKWRKSNHYGVIFLMSCFVLVNVCRIGDMLHFFYSDMKFTQ